MKTKGGITYIGVSLGELKKYFTDDYQDKATYEETLGLLVSKFCEWDGNKIFKVSTSAFEDSNFHSFNEKFEELWKETMDKEAKEWEQVQV